MVSLESKFFWKTFLPENTLEITECNPFKTNEELWSFATEPYNWNGLVQPLEKQCKPKTKGDQVDNISSINQRQAERCNENERLKVLICHDMAGNYHDDRFVNGTKKFDYYRFYHWAGIDYFNYFSHYYITIPPVTWTNAAHRHGVIMLGTYIVEEANLLQEVLSSNENVDRTVDALVVATKNFGFDGWLLNIECEVAKEKIPMLKYLVRSLSKRIHAEIPHGTVIWYDSVIEDGSLKWQNEVNEKNVEMYEGTDGILLNYCWKDASLEQTAKQLNHNAAAMANVFVGIDVFSRSQKAGFDSNEIVRNIKKWNFSVGIFAPAWTFETMDGANPFSESPSDKCNAIFLERENRFWSLLWEHFSLCGPMTLPFYTTFCLGSGRKKFELGTCTSNEPWFNLTKQQYQPSNPSAFEHEYDDAYHGGSCLKFIRNIREQRLFISSFPCNKNIILAFAIKRSTPSINFEVLLRLVNGNDDEIAFIYCGLEAKQTTALEKGVKRYLHRLDAKSVANIRIALDQRDEKTLNLSGKGASDGWEVCYYSLVMDEKNKSTRIDEIAISVNNGAEWNNRDFVLFGALHIHSGLE